jgi:hypothetical protein
MNVVYLNAKTMGYSQSKKTIERVRPILDLVVERSDTLKFPSKTPQKLCYAIRDALAVIKKLPDTSAEKKYNIIGDTFKIRIKEGHVVFEPRERLDYSDPIVELAASKVDEMEFPEALSLLEIVGVCTQHKLKKMVFPRAAMVIGTTDFDRLGRWAHTNNYLITSTEPLTLSRKHGDGKENGNLNEG